MEYKDCMAQAMRGFPKGISRQERGELFCVSAKVCSGKASTETEAKELCLAEPPKPPRKRGKNIDIMALTNCIINSLTELTVPELSRTIASCTGQKAPKPFTRENFIKQCFKENSIVSQLAPREAEKLRNFCQAQYKEKFGSQA